MNESASSVRWDLSVLYSGPNDPALASDLDRLESEAAKFSESYRGHLNQKLDEALAELPALVSLSHKPLAYLFLAHSTDTADAEVKKALKGAEERISLTSGRHLTFFEIELAKLAQEDIDRQAESGENVSRLRPFIDRVRMFRDHMLSEEVEAALAKRAPFGPDSWSLFFDEVESDVRVDLPEGRVTLTEALHALTENPDAERRAAALKGIHESFGGFFLKYSSETLMNVVRAKRLEDAERAYPHPMAARNMSNLLSDETVEALHEAVSRVAAPLMKRHYRLKAELLGLERLAWSDRNAPLPFEDRTEVPFEEARSIVERAYESFSPKLAELVRRTFEEHRVDAPHAEGKRGGAYNYSFCLPDGTPLSFTFLNYLGSNRDVMTLAHELGHGVHGLLAGEAQGTLMMQAPMAYAETASIFGEMVTFSSLTERLREAGDERSALALLMGKADDFANSVVRQIGFSNFERRIHGADHRLDSEELARVWMETVYELYGPEGETFTYDFTERLWSYVSHFHRPFYVYAYATGEIFTQSLFATRDTYGAEFEPMYLELLRAGGTKSAVELLKPFGLDPRQPDFWERGIRGSFGAWTEKAEEAATALELR